MRGRLAQSQNLDTISELSDYIDYQKTHCNCIVCGSNNPISLGLKFLSQPDGSVSTQFRGSSLFQGYQGIVHGGIIATLLDATMTHCLFHNGIEAVTGDLQIRFLKPVPCSSQLELRAWIQTRFSPLYKVESEMICQRDVMAQGKAKFMETSAECEI